MQDKIRVVIYGASGYTAAELLRLLWQHPQVQVCAVISHSNIGKTLEKLHPQLVSNRGSNFDESFANMKCIDAKHMPACDCVFFATPSGVAMKEAGRLQRANIKVIDMSPDFRIKDVSLWQKWYGEDLTVQTKQAQNIEHNSAYLLKETVYGLPEVNRLAIKNAKLIANPGCYATAIQLALLPVILSGKDGRQNKYGKALSGKELVVDAKSGISGAGRRLAYNYLLAEASEDFTCYAAQGHRHQPEMEQALKEASGLDIRIRFVPHLLPVARGIFADLYLPLGTGTSDNEERGDELREVYKKFYAAEPFIRVLNKGQAPHIKQVRASNYCHLAVFAAPNSTYIQVCSVLDNLVKGAAGQAIQNMNLIFGLEESTGLSALSLCP